MNLKQIYEYWNYIEIFLKIIPAAALTEDSIGVLKYAKGIPKAVKPSSAWTFTYAKVGGLTSL